MSALSDKLDALDALITKTGADLAKTIADLKAAINSGAQNINSGAQTDVDVALARLDGISSKINDIDVSGLAADPPPAPAA